MRKVIISGGGTGGHVFPAIAIADALRDLVPSVQILFVGANGKLEMEKVPQAGYEIKGLDIAGFQRRMTLKNLLFPFKLGASMLKAYNIVRKFRPDVVIGVGGYASGPVLKVATFLGVPTVLQEQNSYAGVTNRLLADKACRICVAYEGMERFFPADRLVVSGNPVRKGILSSRITAREARIALGIRPEAPVVLLVGGSLGARTLNRAMMDNADTLAALSEFTIIWQVGRMYAAECANSKTAGLPHVVMMPFIENMDLVYSASDVVVCRAGALTISELSLLGKAAILVPSPNVAEDHQTANARALSDRGAAILLRDAEVADKLVVEMEALLRDAEKRKALQEKICQFAKPDAAATIAREVLHCSKKKNDATD